MRLSSGQELRLSLTDLSTFSARKHSAHLFWKHAKGTNTVEPIRNPDADVLAELGTRHEQGYVEWLQAQGLSVVEIGGSPDHHDRIEATKLAISDGPAAIVQAPLADGQWRGVADVLLRVPGTSALGEYHYEVQDTKLSGNTKAGTILQLSLYSAWLGKIQGRTPERFQVVTPAPAGDDRTQFQIQSYSVGDFAAYTRRMSARFEAFLEGLGAQSRPIPSL